jgi:amidase
VFALIASRLFITHSKHPITYAAMADKTDTVAKHNGLPVVDLLTATSTELQKMLADGSIRSIDLIGLYLAQIERDNHTGLKLNAMISVTPEHVLRQVATSLDEERASGKVRSSLHGIPITVKASNK